MGEPSLCLTLSGSLCLLADRRRRIDEWTRRFMNAIQLTPREARLDTPERCEVAVVYDDIDSRVRAIHLSENLASHFDGDFDLNFTLRNVRSLNAPQISTL